MSAPRVVPVRPDFSAGDVEEILGAIRTSLETGQLAQGEQVAAFERETAAATGARHAVATGTGTGALVCGLRALAARGDGEVLVPANSFYSSAAAPLLAGLRTRLVDVEPDTLAPSVRTLREAVTPSTVGVLTVHLGGLISPELPEVAAWCAERGLWLYEDCAHAHGSRLDGRHAGRFGVAGAFSYFATKVITAAEGGMVVTDDDELAAAVRLHRNLGKPEEWRSHHTVLGENARMSELHAAVGRVQLRRLDEFLAVRGRLARQYTAGLAHIPGLTPVLPRHTAASWYKYVVLLDPGTDRAALRAALAEAGVRLGGEIYEKPLDAQPVFESLLPPGRHPVAEDLCARHICLPLHTRMTKEDIGLVLSALPDALKAATG
ncbi:MULTISPECIES: DegT/DnrJ/EryC1/StrS family aminotransferase [Streptomyces]|uniref:dTDP-4-amino-4,6-dideoxygalactose transaminase n=1 Tax=Streptomyces demainii TaxID=588122 RepID=A0ABT9KWJ1_9ACTN|nr:MULTISPECIES: DegT/DnrJ/EryC1/StrS family aminotransferase [Streptomyces]MBW8093099.1 DegT/DnrJ/EryC1/StrS family aminotransferase [Streptomyces hygroscopicus subsp. hygroscopicus]MCO8306792.1 DegT/DnrJ/EryC1/StrS family aminotransferase [Streptomyces sp. RKCA744]MDP9612806.1 dTDP-4-amino-4,6-dideoxygalactose transaminase [Streptomyces demainii]